MAATSTKVDEEVNDNGVVAMRAFNDAMAHEHDLHRIIVPIGDGLWVGVKK